MNAFQVLGDMLHLASFLILIMKMFKTKSCSDISLKSQVLYALVFICRYLNLFWYFGSYYLMIMKILFILFSSSIVCFVWFKFYSTFDKGGDTFNASHLALGAAILALLFHDRTSPFEIIWTFSIYLEAVAIFPQLFMLSRKGKADNFIICYLFSLGAYKILYLINWIYRYYADNYFHPYTVIAGVVQVALYIDFFYVYLKR